METAELVKMVLTAQYSFDQIRSTKRAWPNGLAEQAHSVRGILAAFNGPATAERVARSFTRARTDRVTELLDTLVSLGQCRALEDGRYVA